MWRRNLNLIHICRQLYIATTVISYNVPTGKYLTDRSYNKNLM